MRNLSKGLRVLLMLAVFLAARVGVLWADDAKDNSKLSKWNYKITGEERFRYEYKKDFDFNRSSKDNGSQLYHRLRLAGNASLLGQEQKPKLDIFVEGLDAQTGGYQLKSAANQTDDFDLHQAYANIHNIFGSDVDIKAGRQELKYGKGRLVAAPSWSNRIRSFDAGVFHYQKGVLWGDLFYGQDVKYDDDKFNQSRSEEFLAGFYGGYQKQKKTPLFEGYFLSLTDIKGGNDIERYTVGGRIQASIAEGMILDVEFPYQFGHTGSATVTKKEIKAYAFHVDVVKTWEKACWKPKLTVAYDEASGDKDPNDSVNNTFIPVYQSTHDVYGLLDLFRWQNMRNPEISATFSPTEKIKFTPQVDFFWLNSKFDSWYNSSGTAVRSKTSGDREYYVGTELSLRGHYEVNKNLKLESGYAHFFSGGYAKDSGADDDVDWFYSQLAFKF